MPDEDRSKSLFYPLGLLSKQRAKLSSFLFLKVPYDSLEFLRINYLCFSGHHETERSLVLSFIHIIHIFQQLWLWCFVSGISKRKIYQPGAYKLLQLLCLRPFKDSPIFPPQNRSLYALKIDLVSWKHLLVRLLLSDRMAVQSKWNICHISFWLYIFFGAQPTLGAYNSLILQSLQEEEENLPFWVIRVIFD